MFYNDFPSIGKLWSCFCLSFQCISNKLKTRSLFHCIAYDYSHIDWESLCDHLRDVPLGDIFKLSGSAPSELCKWVLVGTNVYIPHLKYQDKSHSSPWFSAACAAAVVLRNHFLCFYQQNKSSECIVKVKFRQASKCS